MHYEAPAIDRLNITDYNWSNECLHGVCTVNATVFPQSIGIAATWNIPLMSQISNAISDEARVFYRKKIRGLTYWSPNINLLRDPRWGRAQETYGEDPYLTSRMGVAFIKGLQGDDKNFLKTIASPKHFTAHSGPEGIRFSFNSIVSERDLRESYLPAFKAAITEGKANSIMSSYNAINGIPNSANKGLLTDILRKEWGFNGYVVSDCGALAFIQWGHLYSKSEEESVALALKAGLDLECDAVYFRSFKAALAKGLVKENELDTSLFRLMKARFLLGMFEPFDSVKYNFIPDSVVDSYANRQLSLLASKESIVLLKNHNNTLPLSKDIKSVLVIGPNAKGFVNGNYSGVPSKYVSIFDGIRAKLNSNIQVDYLKGCDLVRPLTIPISKKNLKTPEGLPGLKGEYFNNMYLMGKPDFVRIDSSINFDWFYESPDNSIRNDSFSVRWTGFIRFDKEEVVSSLRISADDGFRLFLDDKLIIDKWQFLNSVPQYLYDTLIADHEYKFVLEYYDSNSASNVRFEYGSDTTGSGYCNNITDVSRKYDVCIFVGGLWIEYENEIQKLKIPGFLDGDRTTLDLPECQQKILKALNKSGKPVVLVLCNGSAMSINWENENIPAIIEAWYQGEEGGTAIGDVLFGDYNPSGKLPLTFYKSVNDLPDFSNYSMSGRTYRYFDKPVLYPFGYGLSYSTFSFESMEIPFKTIKLCERDTIPIFFSIKNTSLRTGAEVAQLYIRNLDSKFIQPNKQLKGFKKIEIKPSQLVNDSILLNLNELYSYDTVLHKYFVESGRYEVQLGSSSVNIHFKDTIIVDNCITDSVEPSLAPEGGIFPIPAEDILYLKTNNSNHNLRIEIISVEGIKVMDLEYSTSIDIHSLSPGVYFIRVGNFKEKFIKIR